MTQTWTQPKKKDFVQIFTGDIWMNVGIDKIAYVQIEKSKLKPAIDLITM